MNCLELAKKFYKQVFNQDLVHHFEVDPDNRKEIQNLVYTSKGDFDEVETPEFGDVVLIRIEGLESHIAIYVGKGLILHTLKSTQMSVIDRLSRWKYSTSGFYRLRERNA